MTAILPNQLTFDDFFRMAQTPEPQFAKGETIYIRSLDVVLRGTVVHAYLCGVRTEKPYYGYHVDFPNGLHTSVWDYQIGDKVFRNERDALKKAESLHFIKLLLEQIVAEDCKAFEYIRERDNHRLTATIGKIGDCSLYESDFMCYHFIRTYPNQKKRDTEYRKMLKKMQTECEECGGAEIKAVFETVYRVTDKLYASRQYAEHNGATELEN